MRLGLVALALVGTFWIADASAGQGQATPDLAGVWLQTEWTESVLEAAALDAPVPLAEPAAAVQVHPLEMGLLELTNRARASHGLGAVEFDPELLGIARARALAQVGQPALSHLDGTGSLAFSTLLKGAGLPYYLAGENLARLGGLNATAAERAQQALMNSPTHRANILDPQFNRLAVGMAQGDGKVVFAEIFRAY
jgi:uncharacterized protein YkwD